MNVTATRRTIALSELIARVGTETGVSRWFVIDQARIDAFADAVTALDSSVPTGTYVDMCSNLPVVDPEKITVPTLIMRGQWDGIASVEDLLAFFARLPNPDKHFAVMPGISHASFQQKNYTLVYHILWSFFTQPAPIYRG